MKKLFPGLLVVSAMLTAVAADEEGAAVIRAETTTEVSNDEGTELRVAIKPRQGIRSGEVVDANRSTSPGSDGEAPIILELTPSLQRRLTKPITPVVKVADANSLAAPTKRTIQLDPPAVKVVNRTDKFVFHVVKD